jgi:hypothetical protein
MIPKPSKQRSDSGAANRLKAPTTPGQTAISAAYGPPCSNYWSAPDAHACKAATPAARLKWPSRQSRSTSSTRQAGASPSKPNTRSGCASRSPSDTTISPTHSMTNSGYSPRARHGSCTGNYLGRHKAIRSAGFRRLLSELWCLVSSRGFSGWWARTGRWNGVCSAIHLGLVRLPGNRYCFQ